MILIGDKHVSIFSGTKVKARIGNEEIIGVLHNDNDGWYFCQNEQDGAPSPEKYGYKYSWIFSISGGKSNLPILKVIDYDLCKFPQVVINDNKVLLHSGAKKCIRLFKIKPHPNCCGCNIVWDFSYYTLKDNMKTIEKVLSEIKTPLIAHLSSTQLKEITVLKEIGFETKYNYKNPNSGNTIYVMHYQN